MKDEKLEGIIAVATDDLLHGGGPRHWQMMKWIQGRYKLGKWRRTIRRQGDRMFAPWEDQRPPADVREGEDQNHQDLKRKKTRKA